MPEQTRQSLTELEQVQRPTPYARGALAAARLLASSEADRARVAAIEARWGPQS